MQNNKVKYIINRGLVFTLLTFLLSFSFIFGSSYAIKNWILPYWSIAIIIAIVFVSCVILGVKFNWSIFVFLVAFLGFSIAMILFIHGIFNLNLISLDLWMVYISICFIVGFLIGVLFERRK